MFDVFFVEILFKKLLCDQFVIKNLMLETCYSFFRSASPKNDKKNKEVCTLFYVLFHGNHLKKLSGDLFAGNEC